ncbi:MAG: hypothetical protein GXO74_15870 [Calditrichaeota bacterium]|nr:hypothetical protein [Calditrichota bacterium]
MRGKNKPVRRKLYDTFEVVNEGLQRPSVSLISILLILLVAIVLLGFVWQKVAIVKLVTEIDQLEKERQKLEENIGTLNSQALSLSDEDRLVKIGVNDLHMIYPKTEVIEQENIYQDSDFKRLTP